MIIKRRTYSKVKCWSLGFPFSGHLDREAESHNYSIFLIKRTYKYKSGGFLSFHASSSFVETGELRSINGTECSVFAFRRYSSSWSQNI
jgi:hypothetical protein